MNIVIIGATGNVGSRILAEALRRGHHVTAIVRDPTKLAPQPQLTVKKGDVTDPAALASLFKGADAVFSAYNAQRGSPDYRDTVWKAYATIRAAAKNAGVKRLLMVGGAGSLEVAPGVRLVNTPNFPAEYKVESQTFSDLLDDLGNEKELDWTFISPAAYFYPGERTGKFRISGNELVRDAQGESKISMEDYAIAFLDEAENPRHIRQRFGVGC